MTHGYEHIISTCYEPVLHMVHRTSRDEIPAENLKLVSVQVQFKLTNSPI